MNEEPLILIVDDYDANRYLRSGMLRKAGYRVIEAGGGREALERIAADRPDLVILDVQMPDLDGLEVCRRVRLDPMIASTLILHVSATAITSESIATGLDNGADGYLTDAVSPEVLLATVRSLLRIRRAEEELRRANQLKDEFLATLSHELRTPLNAIVGWSQMLQSGKLTSDLTQRAVEAIARNALAQRQLINDVLDVSRIVTGKMRLEPKLFDLTVCIQSAIDAFRPALDAKGLELFVTQPATGLPLMGDPDRLQQVFWNLLSNAVKFTPQGGRILVEVRPGDSAVEIEVRDTGVGIPEWFLPHVFERFSQMDGSMNRRHHGLGLGLALVRHLVELHGGTVRADSEGEGRGSAIVVTLPFRLDAPSLASDAGQRVNHLRSGLLRNVTVLLVDDEADSRQIVGAVLRQAGAEVSEANSAQAALAMLPLLRPDVLVSDIGMPEQDGLEMIRAVRELPSAQGGAVPAIALTAYGRDEDRDIALAAGYQLHIAKPVLPAELAQQVAALAATARPGGRPS